jgi:hypothetical protein
MPDLAPDLAAGEIAGPCVGWRDTVIHVEVDVGIAGPHLPYQGAERASLEIAFELVKEPPGHVFYVGCRERVGHLGIADLREPGFSSAVVLTGGTSWAPVSFAANRSVTFRAARAAASAMTTLRTLLPLSLRSLYIRATHGLRIAPNELARTYRQSVSCVVSCVRVE